MNFKHYFIFNKEQQIGLVTLVILIISIQLVYSFVDFNAVNETTKQETDWLSLQQDIDSLKGLAPQETYKLHPFNPNFITDFKGYKLGMKPAEIDRLLAFRKTNKYVNSAEEFQQVTKISDSLLKVICPLFKFPDWVSKKSKSNSFTNGSYKDFSKKEKIEVIDINKATKEDLMKIYGIGEAISDRILKQKEIFGNFVSMEQMQDIWGLSPEVIEELNKYFKISGTLTTNKIDINTISSRELTKFPYFKFAIAKEIVTYRSMNNGIKNIDDLTKIKGFPVDKIQIIALYLKF